MADKTVITSHLSELAELAQRVASTMADDIERIAQAMRACI
jgi:hypothetical protein